MRPYFVKLQGTTKCSHAQLSDRLTLFFCKEREAKLQVHRSQVESGRSIVGIVPYSYFENLPSVPKAAQLHVGDTEIPLQRRDSRVDLESPLVVVDR